MKHFISKIDVFPISIIFHFCDDRMDQIWHFVCNLIVNLTEIVLFDTQGARRRLQKLLPSYSYI